MKDLKIPIIFSALFVAVFFFHGGKSHGEEMLPFDLKIVGPKGNERSLEFLKGRHAILAVYTSSMPDCKKQMERFVRLSETIDNEEILFLGVDVSPHAFEEFVKNVPAHVGRVLFAKDKRGELAHALGVQLIPTTFFISADGKIVEKIESIHRWDSEDFRERADTFIASGI